MGCPAEVNLESNLTFSICCHDADTGNLTDSDSPPAYRVYESETATPILTGTMSKLDDANTTGFYTETIACTVANGFEDGKTYTIYIEATVDSDTGGISYAFRATAKTGYSLAADGLDAIADPDDLTPATVPSTFTQKLRWLIQRFWKADKSVASITVKNEAGATITTQAITASGTDETVRAPT